MLLSLPSKSKSLNRRSGFGFKRLGIAGLGLLLVMLILVVVLSFPAGVQAGTVRPMISAGDHHTLALKNDGTVWAWGWNEWGQLGDGHFDRTLNYSSTPVQVVGPGGVGYLNNIVAVSTGHMYSLALRSDGTVWAWGYGNSGQLGNDISGGNYYTAAPVQVKGPGGSGVLTGVTAIAAGTDFSDHSLALKNDGTVWAWGANGNGQLGDGTWSFRKVPVQVKGPGGSGFLTGVKAICAGHHSLALKTDGTLWAWGTNNDGQLGIGTAFDNKNTPVQVKGPGGSGFLTGVTAISAHSRHSLALKNDGTVWGWGWNLYSQLGNDESLSIYHRYTPVQTKGPGGVGFLSGITAINAGHDHSLALKNDGTVWAWGNNMNGRLGDGTTMPKRSPAQVLKGASPSGTSYLSDVSAVSAGLAYSLALRKDGTLWAWGSNSNGKLGDGTTVHERQAPVQSLINLGAEPLSYSATLYWQHQDGRLKAWHMDGSERVEMKALNPSSIDSRWQARAIVDMNGNGHDDIVFQHEDGGLQVWYMEGLNRVGVASIRRPGGQVGLGDPNWQIMAVYDLNNSGSPDIIFQYIGERLEGQLAVWLMDGLQADRFGRLYNRPGNAYVSPLWEIGAVYDLLGNGKPEVIWQSVSGGAFDNLAYWELNVAGDEFTRSGSGRLRQPGGSAEIRSEWRMRTAVDLLGNGRHEILFQGIRGDFNGRVSYWEMTGVNRTRSGRLTPDSVSDPRWRLVGSGS